MEQNEISAAQRRLCGSEDADWARSIPPTWDAPRIKSLLRERNERGHPNQPLLAATQKQGVILKERYENRTVLPNDTDDLSQFKLVEKGDFVISLRSFQGGVERAHDKGLISPAYTILRSNKTETVEFLTRLFKSRPFIDTLTTCVTGIRQGQNIDYTRLSTQRIPLPPLDEQVAIVRYLDDADQRIQAYVNAKERLIALLEEERHVVIHQAVTRGLDPNVKLKPSNFSWVGDIPQHWKQCRLRNVVSQVTTGSRGWSSYSSDTGPLFIRVANLNRGSLELRFDDVVRLNLPETSETTRTRIQPSDILVSVTAYIGSVGIAPKDLGEAYVSQHVARCLPLPGTCSEWLGYVLLSEVGQTHGQMSLYGGTKDGLSLDDVKNYPILLPPQAEQLAIVEYIKKICVESTDAIDHARSQVELMEEYRTRLIADVVTGKIDVTRV